MEEPHKNIDLSKSQKVEPVRKDVVHEVPPFKDFAGFFLAKRIVLIIGVVIGILLLFIIIDQIIFEINLPPTPNYSSNSTSLNYDSLKSYKEIIEYKSMLRKEHRDFLLNVAEIILLNILLPVLTALLGYIFGSGQAGQSVANPEDS